MALLPATAARPLGSLTSAGTPLIEAENLFRQPGPPQCTPGQHPQTHRLVGRVVVSIVWCRSVARTEVND
jgi:hypothetical protein